MGLSIAEYLQAYSNYLELGGLDFPIYLPVDANGIVNVMDVKWGRLTEPIPIDHLRKTPRYISVPFIQSGAEGEAKLAWYYYSK